VVDAAAEMQYWPPWRPVRATINTHRDVILVCIFHGSYFSFSTGSEELRATTTRYELSYLSLLRWTLLLCGFPGVFRATLGYNPLISVCFTKEQLRSQLGGGYLVTSCIFYMCVSIKMGGKRIYIDRGSLSGRIRSDSHLIAIRNRP
jgi:hypothetical protein